MNKKQITKVSEYLANGGLSTGMLLEAPTKETEKALAFHALRYNGAGRPYNGTAWLPKSQLTKLQNDHYTNGPAVMFFCPAWLYQKNFPDGEEKVS